MIMVKNLIIKLVATALVFMFLFQPLALVSAEQIDVGVFPGSDDSQSSSPPDSSSDAEDSGEAAALSPSQDDGKDDEKDVKKDNGKDNSADPSAEGEGPGRDNGLAQPTAPSASPNNALKQNLPEIDRNTGALTYNYPISIPPGRNNLQPEIGLSYNSNSNEQDSIFGYGWTLNIPHIKRLNKSGSDKLYDPLAVNYYYSSLDGELTAIDSSSYIARTENGNFNKYVFQNNQWLVTAKNGTQYKFGYDASSQQNDPQNPGNVYKWMLQEIRDTNDNYIFYTYFKDGGQIYPSVIKYTGSGSADGIFEIDFSTEASPDATKDYNTGFSVATNYRINQITTVVNGNWVNKYVLAYEKNQVSDKSLLKSITTSGKDSDGNIVSLPATSFNYQSGGSGWTKTSLWEFPSLPAGETNWLYPNPPPQFTDLNGDGLTDLVLVASHYYQGNVIKYYQYLNNGNGWTQTSLWDLPSDLPAGETYWQYLSGIPPQFTDLNGDGLTDLVLVASHYQYGNVLKDYQYLNGALKQDLLNKIIYPYGGNTTIEYKASTQYRDDSGSPANKAPYPIFTVSQITNSDGAGNNFNFFYNYQGGHYYYNGPFDRQFSGYKTVIQTDGAGNITKTYYHTADESDSALGEYNDEYWKIGKAYRVEMTDSPGYIYSKTINKWDSYDLGNGSKFVKLSQTINAAHDGNATHRDSAESYDYDNNTGNQIQKIQWGEVLGNDDGSFSDIGSDKFTTDYAYASNISAHIIGLPSKVAVVDQNANKVKESKFYYDLQDSGSVIKGNLTKQEDWKTGTAYINSQKTYNNYGLATASIDPRGKTTQYVYDGYNLYPVEITNALNQSEQYAYNYSSGQVAQKIDSNNRVFQYIYDGLGRLIEEKQPDIAVPSNLATKNTYIYTDTPDAVSVKKFSYLDESNFVEMYTYFDGLGRKIQERAEAEGSNFSVKDYAYDNRGLLAKESLPYFSVGSERTSPTSDSTLYTNYSYETLGRLRAAINAVGVTSNNYNDWNLIVTDANGKAKDLHKDGYGNLVKVDEHNVGNTYSVLYDYNYLGNIIKITDALSNVRNFTYDNLGRRLTAEDLRAPTDATFGVWTYAYDDAGNLTQTIDPKNQTVNYTYDDINRQLTEDHAERTRPSPRIEVAYTYDNGIDGAGRLTGIASSNFIQNNAYNALGLLETESKIINDETYLTAYEYDRQGNQITVANPDGSQVKNIYNSAGLLDKIQRKESADADFIDVASNIDYAPTGQATAISYANGASTTNNYDAAKLYRLSNKITTIANGIRGQDLTYTYDAVGNIIAIVDASATDSSKNSQYAYDYAYRLTSASISNSAQGQSDYTYNFSYDAIGNILNRTETIGANSAATYTYLYDGSAGSNYANPHAVTSISDGATSVSYIYDENGNMTAEGAKLYAFDYNNRLVQSSIPDDSVPSPITSTFYPLPGDGSIYHNSSNSWITAHNSLSGTLSNHANTAFNVGVGKLRVNYLIERAFIPFNTSALPDNAIISDVKLKVYVESKTDDNNDANDWVSVVRPFQPNTALLTNPDYSKAGNITNPIEGNDVSERKDITDVIAGQYLIFNLNNIGRSWISRTGATKLGLREGHDAKNIAFVRNRDKYNKLKIRSSEYTDTSSDPILEITYTVPASPTVITYGYDPAGQRVKLANQKTKSTTYYPTKFYNIDNSAPTPKATKHVFANSANLATIQGRGAEAMIYYNSADSLNSSSIMTDSAAALVETLDYYPFGGIRIDVKPADSSFSEQRKYIGQEFDEATGLNYLNARYYNADIGRFTSQDPMFWSIDKDWLTDPQNQNSYSYARNNPIISSDPSGLESVLGIRDAAEVGAHGDIIIFPEDGEDFSQYGSGPNYIIAGGPDYSYKPFGNLKANISSASFNQSDYIKIIPLEGDYISPGMTVPQYDQALAKAGDNLSKQNLGSYSPTGRPISPWANSGNVWTQVILDAGGKVPEIQNNYPAPGLFGSNTIHLPLGSGNSMNTPWFPVTVAKNAYNVTQNAVVATATAVKNTAVGVSNYIGSSIKSITAPASSFLNSLKFR